jgi:oxalate---CoA ligase
VQAAKPVKTGDYLELEKRAAQTPHAIALAAPGREPLTYSGLWSNVAATSSAFLQAGIHSGGVAALALPSGPAFVTATLTITLQSACAPLDLGLTRDESRLYLPRIGAATLVFEEGQSSPVVEVAQELGMRLIGIRSSPDDPAGVFGIDCVEGPAEQKPGRQTDAALLLLTSATTDLPKLVPWSRSNIRAMTEQDVRAFELGAADRFLSLLPLYSPHCLYSLFTQLSCGGSVFCPAFFEVAGVRAAFESFRPTWFSGTPAIHNAILSLARENPEFFRRFPLRFLRSAGAPLDPGLISSLEELFGAPVLNGYSSTEMPGATRSTCAFRKPGSVGKSIDAEVAIVDDSGNLLPPETVGEIVARGPTLMSGYLDDSKANQEAFHNSWFRTGDIGRLDHEGYLFLLGRRKEIINRGGKKVSPPEVDTVLAMHPAVAEIAAFAVPHPTLGEDVAAAVVLRDGAAVSELELRRFAAERLATHKVPRRIVFLESLPRTTAGKPKRIALAEKFRDLGAAKVPRPAGTAGAREPTEIELQIIDIWRGILGIEQIALQDNFIELGGDSLTAALMLTQTAQAFHIAQHLVPEADFFDQPTVAALAGMMEDCASRAGHEPRLPNRLLILRDAGRRIPFFCFSSSEFDRHRFRHLSPLLDTEQPFIVVCPSPALENNRRLKIEEVASQSVTSIRALRPRGPYILGGYCYGGVVAFEAAAQLSEDGEQVAMLVLFDTPTPGYPKIARGWRKYAQVSKSLLPGFRGGQPSIAPSQIASHLRNLGRIATRRLSARAKHALASAAKQDLPPEAWDRLIMREYLPPALSAPIVQFLAAEEPVSTQVLDDPRLGWRDFAQSFQTRAMPGSHTSMLDEANAACLAAELEKILPAYAG